MMQSFIQGLDLYIKVLSIKSSQYFLFRFSADLDRMKRGAMEALRLGPSRSLRIPSSTGTGCGPSVPPGLPPRRMRSWSKEGGS